jgi:hypothetical protein
MPLLMVRRFPSAQEKGAEPRGQRIGGAVPGARGDTAAYVPMERNRGLERG